MDQLPSVKNECVVGNFDMSIKKAFNRWIDSKDPSVTVSTLLMAAIKSKSFYTADQRALKDF
jgi:hypothetical protein